MATRGRSGLGKKQKKLLKRWHESDRSTKSVVKKGRGKGSS